MTNHFSSQVRLEQTGKKVIFLPNHTTSSFYSWWNRKKASLPNRNGKSGNWVELDPGERVSKSPQFRSTYRFTGENLRENIPIWELLSFEDIRDGEEKFEVFSPCSLRVAVCSIIYFISTSSDIISMDFQKNVRIGFLSFHIGTGRFEGYWS